LTAGFLTPIVAALLGLLGAGQTLLGKPAYQLVWLDTRWTIVFAAAILVAIFLVGPGAFSLDARLFRRREIIIPPPPPRRH
jgi:uncharacterized membrane protein YphA (DoxX/SURF4 family)